ncbi:MAG: alpha/beta fold hydrolase [Phycisphaeraceae bacterium]|nr:alpha/beta fold hydrolase [Phycisphaeraceae bacterium]
MSSNFGPWDIESLRLPVTFNDKGLTPAGVAKITYPNEPYRGRNTSVFAYMGLPKQSAWKRDGKIPGVVLVHGGGGEAYEYWVRIWNDMGYAAIAMDLSGCDGAGLKLPDYGPNQEADGKFDHLRLGVKETWSYHAIAAIFRAHNILASLPQVDENRIGITGVSWGGYLTSLVAGLDDRYKFAIPVYGCGNLLAGSVWTTQELGFDLLGQELAKLWEENFDPSSYMHQVTYPMLFVNGTNDFAYHPPAWQNTYLQSQGPVTLTMRYQMAHGHREAHEPREILAFANHVLHDTAELPQWTEQYQEDGKLIARFEKPVMGATLLYTIDTKHPNWPQKQWQQVPVETSEDGNCVTVELPKSDWGAAFINVIDENNLLTSTPHTQWGQAQ